METKSAWTAVWVILIGLAMAGMGAYLIYKYRLRVNHFKLLSVFIALNFCQNFLCFEQILSNIKERI